MPCTMLSTAFAPHVPLQRTNALRRTTRHRAHVVTRAQQPSFFESAINSLTVAINNSPLAKGKQMFAVAQAGQYDVDATQAQIKQLLNDNAVVMFSFSTCPFCVRAKGLLNDLGATYKVVELNEIPEGMAIRAELAKMTNRTSMPNVYIKGTSYGGCNDGPGVVPLHRDGKLVPLLKEAGAV